MSREKNVICVFLKQVLSLIKKSIIKKHNVIFAASLILNLQLEQVMCENDTPACTELTWEPPK